ncbi:hypothetical protein [Micromonospora sp. HUAS LYJ1]|uniref:hypothetical protein n=1 Tax=Micromonospora sp. HUAS LYJ1 TaxID=3061626 RepID=UPI002673A4C3|nr:hypothetical protein [Micromonospora sp. HUAS LYJ1]WKU05809.1 hypothetical protein Q2K16_01680 [Micromonospora sp. HUAS LYJ1]
MPQPMRRRLTRLAVVATAAAAVSFTVQPAPAAAVPFDWNGAFATYEECEQYRIDASSWVVVASNCVYRTLPDSQYNGWYFRAAIAR